jgi:hypothetical protein
MPAGPASEGGLTRRESVAGVVILGQALILGVAALVIVATPHSVCHTAASGARTCGGASDAGQAAGVAAVALLACAVAIALLAHARWAPRAGFGLSTLLTAAGLAILGFTYANASASDRSTYGWLWIAGMIGVAILAIPIALLWGAIPGDGA